MFGPGIGRFISLGWLIGTAHVEAKCWVAMELKDLGGIEGLGRQVAGPG